MIKINGKYIRNIPEQVGKNKRDIFTLDTDLTALEVKVNEALVGVFHYKGSVATYADLPASDNEIGDVYNVIDTGKNYAWDGSVWDDLGGLVDLSNYYTKAEADTLLSGKAGLATANTFTQDQTINGNIIFPAAGTTIKLANSNEIGITSTEVKFDSNVRGWSNNAFDLGTSAYAWKDLYLAGNINIGGSYISANVNGGVEMGYNNQAYLVMYTYGIYVNSGITPLANNTHDLGTSSLAWKDIYLAGKSQFSNTAETSTQWAVEEDGYGQLVISRIYNGTKTALWEFNNVEIKPKANNTNKIGNSGRVLDTVFTTKLNDGTNTETIADISALIAYAKAQGWIS